MYKFLFPDHVSFRNKSLGSWYIQALCDVLSSVDLTKNSIFDILTQVNFEIAKRSSSSPIHERNLKKQIPSFQSNLTRKFTFEENKRNIVQVDQNEQTETISIIEEDLLRNKDEGESSKNQLCCNIL